MSSLDEPVLVLNKAWLRIRVIPAYRAITLVFAGKASSVDADTFYAYGWKEWIKQPILEGDLMVVSTNFNVKIPRVIVLTTYDKVFKKNAKLTKRNIYKRDEYRCQYTGKTLKESEADIDHVIPRSKGGKNSWDNMVVCSKEINREKADRTPEQAGLKLLRKPSKPNPDNLIIDPRSDLAEIVKRFEKGNK